VKIVVLQVPAKGWIGATDVDAREGDGRAVTILAMATWVAARGVGNEIGLQHIQRGNQRYTVSNPFKREFLTHRRKITGTKTYYDAFIQFFLAGHWRLGLGKPQSI
jgi:hypothetical protein